MQTESRSQKIAVTGATGRVGSHLVEILEQRGHDVVPIARSKGVDVVSGEGLDEALAGAETIIDTATGPSPDQAAATAVLHRLGTEPPASRRRSRGEADRRRLDHRHRQVPGRLQRGEGGAGADAARRRAPGPDRSRGPVPRVRRQLLGWTIQDGVAHVPEMRTQPVAARVVAETLADAAEEPEIENGRITEVAGPQEERLADAAAALFASRGESVEIREERGRWFQPDDPDAAAYAEGAALPNPGAKLAGPSFEEWLAAA